MRRVRKNRTEHILYQIYTFNTSAKSVTGDEGTWRNTSNGAGLDDAITALSRAVPQKGTSLINAFDAMSKFDSPPDNLFLITDGLPTQGRKSPSGGTVSNRERIQHYQDAAATLLPRRIPVNILLFPMEGDPVAASSFWQLALSTNGSFMSPSKDWP